MNDNNQYSYDVDTLIRDERTMPQHISTAQLQHLVHLLDNSDVSEIEVKRVEEGMRLVLRKAIVASSGETVAYLPAQQSTLDADASLAKSAQDALYTVKASLVGIFHSWIKPRGKDLVVVGDLVKVGQLLGSIQSLNVLSEIESPVAGRVVEFIIQNGQAAEYGQPLMIIDTTEGA